MDYESHMRATLHPSLCNVVNYGEGQVGSMMALMTTDQPAVDHATESDRHPNPQNLASHHQHHHSQHHHQEPRTDHRQPLNTMHVNTAPSAHAQSSSFAFYNNSLEPYLQSALYQATHAFHTTHPVEPHPPILSTLEHLDPSSVVMPTEEEKPDIGAPKIAASTQFEGGRECNYVIATSGAPLLVSPGTSSTIRETRAITTGTVSMETDNSSASVDHADPIRAKIIAHPTYPRLVVAYVNCNKIGAPPEAATKLEEVSKKYQSFRSSSPAAIGADPELDHFMETYCNVLQKYHDELMQPYKEAMAFFRKIELQLNALSKGSLRLSQSGDEKGELANNNTVQQNNGGSSVEEEAEEDGEVSCGEVDFHEEMIDPLAEDQKLKEQLLRKYSGYICGLKQEFLKKKKKGKLPKDARQKLLDWWTQHYKWPYPSEPEKAALAETTGLDQKQINNWFINQRKRHWKPAEDMQYMMVDSPGVHHHVHPHAHLAAHPLASYAVVETMDAAAVAAAATIMPAMHN